MVRILASHEARANFGDLVGSVYYTGEPVVIARKGKPMAVVVSPADFERWRALEGERAAHPDWALRVQFSSGRQATRMGESGVDSGEGGATESPFVPVDMD